MNILKRASTAVLIGLLALTMTMSGCNFGNTVNLVTELAVNLLNSCPAFTSNPVDQAACKAAAVSVQTLGDDVVAAYNSYDANKSQGNLVALQAAIQTALAKLPGILSSVHISDQTTVGRISVGINLVLSIIQVIASHYHVASPTVTARLKALFPHTNSIAAVKAKWNAEVCGGLQGSALANCAVH